MDIVLRPPGLLKSDDLRHRAVEGVLDVTSYLVSCSQQDAIDCCNVAARDPDSGVSEKRLNHQLAQAQFMRRAGVGMAETVRRVGRTDNSSPRLREDGSVRFVAARRPGEDVFTVGFDAGQDCLSSFWKRSDR